MKAWFKEKRKAIRHFLKRKVNGTKGMLSIFLALVVSPLLMSTFIFIEYARIQSIQELMKEVMGSSLYSTLGHYDDYVEERFDLLSISQKDDINTTYQGYMKANMNALGKGASIQSMEASGQHSLGSASILKQQIYEASEYTVMAQAMWDGFDLDRIKKKLDGLPGMKQLNAGAEVANKVVGYANDTKDMINSVKDFWEKAKDFKKKCQNYKTKYKAFQAAMEAVEAIRNSGQEEGLPAAEAAADAAARELATATKELSTSLGNLYDASKDLKGKMEKVKKDLEEVKEKTKTEEKKTEASTAESTASTGTELATIPANGSGTELATIPANGAGTELATIPANGSGTELATIPANGSGTELAIIPANGTSTEVATVEPDADFTIPEGNGEETIGTDAYKWFEEMHKATEDFANKQIQKGIDAIVEAEKTSLNNQAVALSSFSASTHSMADLSSTPLGKIEIKGFDEDLETYAGDLVKILDKSATEDEEGVKEVIKIGKLAKKLMEMKIFYDNSLDSNINPALLAHKSSFDTSTLMTASGFAGMLQDAIDFADACQGFPNVFKAITKLVSFMINLAKFLAGLVTWIAEHFINLAKFLVNYQEYYHAFLLYGYAAYNLPNRTTYQKGSTLTGYSFQKVFKMAGGSDKGGKGGAMSDIASLGDNAGSDPMLKGAELEYMLTGANSEYAAQAGAFFDGYMLRLMVDCYAVFNSDILKALSALGPVRIVATVIFLLLEPFLDMVILVNGGTQVLFKTTAYLSIKGLPHLAQDMAGILDLDDDDKSTLKGMFESKREGGSSTGTEVAIYHDDPAKHGGQDGSGKTNDKNEMGYFPLDYTAHGAILMILCTPYDQYTERMQNIIQLEAKEKHKKDFDFDINKAYTSVHSDNKYKLNVFMNLSPSLTGGFSFEKQKDLAY